MTNKKEEEHHGNIHDEPPGGTFINTKAEILDYEIPECNLIMTNEIIKGKKFQIKMAVFRTAAFITVGVITGLVSVVILFIHEELAVLKNQLLTKVIDKYTILSAPAAFTWIAGVLIPAMIGCLLVVFIEPKAAGGGVAGIVGYVNGVDTSATLTMKILIVKSVSVICCITAGLAGGMEGPMVHIGSILAACLPNFHISTFEPFRELRTDSDKRDLIGGGIASGIAAAFFAPIGGFVMAMEEGMLYWNLQVIFNILVCSFMTDIIVASLMSIVFGCSGCLSVKTFLFFSVINETVFSHQLTYLLLYFLEAVIAGFFGALWNMGQTKLILLRKKCIKHKWQQILEMFILSVVTAVCGWIMLFIFRHNCVQKPHHVEGFHFGSLKMECKEGEITGIGTLISHTQANAIRFLFYDSDEFDIPTLAIFGVIYFILTVVTMGTFISAGIFIPNLFLGSVWGRLYGEILKKIFFANDVNFRPSVFAIIGASCQLCGVIRIPYTLGVIMMESSGTTAYIFPIFLSQIITTIVGNIFNHSIYHTQCFLAGMPIAETEPPPFCADIEVQTLMNTHIKSLRKRERIQNLLDILKTTKHNMYPILKNRIVEGSILRYQLIKILKYKMYENTNISELFRQYVYKDHPPFTMASINEDELPMSTEIDLEPFMNKSPYTLLTHSSFNNAYNLMSFMGARHIIVVNKRNEIQGVLTRKDVLFYREHSSIFGVHVARLQKI